MLLYKKLLLMTFGTTLVQSVRYCCPTYIEPGTCRKIYVKFLSNVLITTRLVVLELLTCGQDRQTLLR